jgi:hypothetical protein
MTESTGDLLRRPSAWLPIAISAIALAMVLGYAAMVGTAQRAAPHDEGAPARVFQLLMLTSAIATASFAVRWLPRAPRESATIVVLQLLVAALPIAAIVLLES